MLDPLLHNTASATVLDCDDKFNVIPGEVAVVLGRLLPGFAPDDLLAELHALLGDGLEPRGGPVRPGPPEPDMGLFPPWPGSSSAPTPAPPRLRS